MNDSFNPNHIGDDSVPSTRMTTQSSPPSLAPKTAQRTSLGRRLQRALTGGPNRRFPGLHSPLGGTASASLLASRRLAFPIVALLAALAVGLLFLLPGGLAWAQDANGPIEYPEKGTGLVATYTATDPERASVRWSLGGDDAGDFTIENGVLRFAKTPNYESAADANMDNTYVVDVQATDETRRTKPETVTVNVTNVDEDGTVKLSALRPQSATAFTASITDPDGATSNAKWQWSRSRSKNGAYSPIDKATSAIYTPVDDYIGDYLRATVTYTDPEGEDKTAKMESDFTVQGVRGSNMAPEFAADQDPNMPLDQAEAARSVAENTEAGSTVGDPVTADPKDGDVLTYTLEDADGGIDGDSAKFDIDRATGQILTKEALDSETTPSYTVVVRATDPAGVPGPSAAVAATHKVTVNITVTDVNDAPVVAGTSNVDFEETTDTQAAWSEIYTETDQDTTDPARTWSLGGSDGSKFDIAAGSLKFKKQPDYEKPTDADMDNVYEVTVQASDGKLTGMLKVKVTVINEDEAGTVSLDKVTPVVGIPVTATLKDPDGGISKLTWQWSIGAGAASTTSGPIAGATSDTYTPKAGDVGGSLTATATYFDGQNTPSDITDNSNGRTVPNATPPDVERDTRNKPPVFGDEDPDTSGVQNSAATRKVEENTEDNVGAVVDATDAKADGTAETLQYSLSGADMSSFRVDNNGQITVGSGTKLDYEGKRTYMVTVTATDPLGASSSIPVTIEVTDVDEAPEIMRAPDANVAPEFASATTSRMVAENTVAGKDIGNPVAATDNNDDTLTYALSGTDAASFDIDTATGQLMTLAALDFETKASYTVEVTATDGAGESDAIMVTVTVTNADEPGTVTLSAAQPVVGAELTASLSDPDDVTEGSVTWQWARGAEGDYEDIGEATSKTYTPVAEDAGKHLRVAAGYNDGEGSGKTAQMVSDKLVDTAPAFEAETAERSVAENTVADMAIGEPVEATDADAGDTLTYTLGGDDATSFAIDEATGQLMTLAALDFETKASYTVEVTATDGAGESDAIMVTITVTNMDEAGTVTLPTMQPQVGVELTASVEDPDGGVTAETWQWASSDAMDGTFTSIEGAISDSYTPVADDVGKHLRATASYTDGHGSGKTAMATSANTVTAGDPLLARYDTDQDDEISRTEVIAAINDYLFGVGANAITKDQAIAVINLYLF